MFRHRALVAGFAAALASVYLLVPGPAPSRAATEDGWTGTIDVTRTTSYSSAAGTYFAQSRVTYSFDGMVDSASTYQWLQPVHWTATYFERVTGLCEPAGLDISVPFVQTGIGTDEGDTQGTVLFDPWGAQGTLEQYEITADAQTVMPVQFTEDVPCAGAGEMWRPVARASTGDYAAETGAPPSVPDGPAATLLEGDTGSFADQGDPVNTTLYLTWSLGRSTAVDFEWSMPDRFDGLDHDGNGLVDYFPSDGSGSDSSLGSITPASWHVNVDASDNGSCKRGLYSWSVDGTLVGTTPLCTYGFDLPSLKTYTVRLDVTYMDGGTAWTEKPVTPKDWLIVSIGDSLASGEGNPDHDATWESSRCDRSAAAGPALAAAQVERMDPHSSVTFIHLACSGAKLQQGLLAPFDGENPTCTRVGHGCPRDPPLAAQLSQLKQLIGDRQIDALVISAGANDIGFSDMAIDCYLWDCASPTTDYPRSGNQIPNPHYIDLDELQRKLDKLGHLYDELYACVRILSPEGCPDSSLTLATRPANVYFTLPHDPTQADDGTSCTGSTPLGIDATEWQYIALYVLPMIRDTMVADTPVGVNLLSQTMTNFARHGECANNSWVRNLSQSLAIQHDLHGTLHPNGLGHLFGICPVILGRLLSDLPVGAPAPTTDCSLPESSPLQIR